MKLLIAHFSSLELWRAPAWLGPRLAGDFPQHQFVQLESYDRVPLEIEETDIFIGWQLKPQDFPRAARLNWIHTPTAAVNQLMDPEMIASRVRITNSTGIHGPVVAEHALALILALAKRIPSSVRHQMQKQWAQSQVWSELPHPREIAGST